MTSINETLARTRQIGWTLTWSPMSFGCPSTATRVIPGRSIKVKSGTPCDVICSEINVSLIPTFFPAIASCAKRDRHMAWIHSLSSRISLVMFPLIVHFSGQNGTIVEKQEFIYHLFHLCVHFVWILNFMVARCTGLLLREMLWWHVALDYSSGKCYGGTLHWITPQGKSILFALHIFYQIIERIDLVIRSI